MERAMKRYVWILVLPTFAAFLVAFLIPFVMGIYLSFCKFTTVVDAEFIGLKNYTRMFHNGDFVYSLLFTTAFTIVTVIVVNLIAFLLALGLTKAIRGTNLFRTVFFMPNLIGGIVLGYIWQLIINGILLKYGVTLTTDAKYGFWGLVVLTVWQLTGYMMIIYIAGIQNISTELIEAAKIDGATGMQILRRVTIPLVMPSVTICLFLTITNSFKMFDQNLALTAGLPGKKTQMLALDIYNTFYGRTGWEGVGQAKAVIFFLIVAVIALVQLYFTRRKEVES